MTEIWLVIPSMWPTGEEGEIFICLLGDLHPVRSRGQVVQERHEIPRLSPTPKSS
jgi:hypothetical protein